MTADEYNTAGLTEIPDGPTPNRAVVTHGPDFAPVRLEIMTTEEYERGDVPIPALVSVTEAATVLGISRQAVLSRINNGTLAHVIVGQSYAIPASAVSSSGSSTTTSSSERVSVARGAIARGGTP